MNNTEKVAMKDLYVITFSENKIFGNYEEEELFECAKELFIKLKEYFNDKYSIEKQMKFIYNDMIALFEYINLDYDYISYERFKEFLKFYNKIAPHNYNVKKIEIEEGDEPIVIGYICDYGLDNYLNDFQTLEIEQIYDDCNSCTHTLAKNEVENFLIHLIKSEIKTINEEYTPIEILETKNKYLNKLVNKYEKIKKGYLTLVVLSEFIEDYNLEYKDSPKHIKIIK